MTFIITCILNLAKHILPKLASAWVASTFHAPSMLVVLNDFPFPTFFMFAFSPHGILFFQGSHRYHFSEKTSWANLAALLYPFLQLGLCPSALVLFIILNYKPAPSCSVGELFPRYTLSYLKQGTRPYSSRCSYYLLLCLLHSNCSVNIC